MTIFLNLQMPFFYLKKNIMLTDKFEIKICKLFFRAPKMSKTGFDMVKGQN